MMKYIIAFTLLISNLCFSQTKNISPNDTTVVGKVVQYDSTNYELKIDGIDNYYFGIFHLKVAVLNEELLPADTLLIGIVYNKLMEGSNYIKHFGLDIYNNYIFKIHLFTPCSCNNLFQRLEGKCVEGKYFPKNCIVKSYRNIYQVVYYTKLTP